MGAITVAASLHNHMSCIFLVFAFLQQGSIAVYLGQNDSLNFMVLADWGGQPDSPFYTVDEFHVAKQMGILASSYESQFVLALGDNFYYYGVKSVDDPRFNETFEDVFTADSLQVPWYLVAGNHDWHGSVQAQIDYSKVSKRWNFPTFYYMLRYQIPSSQKTVTFIMIDTVMLCGNTDDSNVLQQPTKPKDLLMVAEQFAWIEEQLKATMNDTYVIVAGHYPVWSIAEHGPTDCLVQGLRPMLIKYNVSAYFSGHDHNLQHIKEDNSSVEYFVIGAAHVVDSSVAHKGDVPATWVKFHYADKASLGGFSYMEATPSGMDFTFADGRAGKSLYHATIKPRM